MAKSRSKKRAAKRSNEFYRAALIGVTDREGELSPGLRSTARGFKASQGFNLRALKAGEWTPAQKAKVTRYWHELEQLTAQEKVIVHTRSPMRLAVAQAIGGHDPRYDFKVAFVPGSAKAKVIWSGNDITVREPIGRGKYYLKRDKEFDPVRLAIDPKREVARVVNLPDMKKAHRFRINAGKNLIGNMYDREILAREVIKLQMKYDGRSPLPKSSGNRGDNPKVHYWGEWLHGVTGYIMPYDVRRRSPVEIGKEIERNRDLQRRRRNERKRMAAKRKGNK